MVEDIPGVLDYDRLADWMDAGGLNAGPITDAALLAGGTQNILVRFRKGEKEFVLRRPGRHLRPNSNEAMCREARLLAAIAQTAVPHPRFIADCNDDSIIGACFYLMEPVDGFNATTGLPTLHANSATARHRMGLSLIEGIAALGALDHEALNLSDFGKPDNFLERQVPRWKAQLSSYAVQPGWPGPGQSLPGVEKIADWLESHRPRYFDAGIMHGDFHLSNAMFRNDGPELAAIVDWELATIGDPLLDLGWLIATWPENDTPGIADVAAEPWTGFPSAQELIEHYRQRSTRDLSAMAWYTVLACFKLGILLEGTYARACAGKAPQETGDLLHAKAVGLFERALRIIT